MKHRTLICVAAGVIAVGSSFSMAQQRSHRPPQTTSIDKPPTIRNYLVLGLLAAAVIAANMIPSKRGHQD